MLVMLVLEGSSSEAAAQDTVEVPSEPVCSGCAIDVESVLELGTFDGLGALGKPVSVARDDRGRLYVVSMEIPEIVVFDRTGDYLRTLGREGAGPGEYRYIFQIDVTDDNGLHVFDTQSDRQTVLSPSRELARTNRLPPGFRDAIILSDSTTLISANIPTREKAGLPLHVLNSEGELVRSFGADSGVARLTRPYASWRRLALSSEGTFWSANVTRYVVRQWKSNGQLLRTLIRVADWFVPYPEGRLFTTEAPPYSMVNAVREDVAGRLWVLVTVADEQWQQALVWDENHPDGPRYVFDDAHDYFDTIIEVLDPAIGRVFATKRIDWYIGGFVDDSRMFSYHETATGVPSVVLWEVRLIQPSRR